MLCSEIAAVYASRREGPTSRPACVSWSLSGAPLADRSNPLPAMELAAPSLRAAPNPFNPSTRLTLTLPASGAVRAAIYDVAGRRVALLHDGVLAAGTYSFDWAPAAGRPLRSGVYFARVEAGANTLRQKLVLVK